MLLSLSDDLQAIELSVQKLKAKIASLFKTKAIPKEEYIEYIDDPETIKSIGKSLADYKAGRYITLKTKEDIHNFVASL